MALQYPKKFETGMPFIHFKAYDYVCPKPSIGVLDIDNAKQAANVEEISLYMPGDFSENISSQWGFEDMLLGGTGQGLTADLVSNIAKSVGSKYGDKVVSNVKGYAGHLPFPSDINIFQTINPTEFSLTFNMIPYDADEAKTILDICNEFKINMLPEAVLNNTVLRFPCIWDLTFAGINGLGLTMENTYELMCMTSCNVSYISGTEGASVYKDQNPTQVRLSLAFTSLRKQFYGGE